MKEDKKKKMFNIILLLILINLIITFVMLFVTLNALGGKILENQAVASNQFEEIDWIELIQKYCKDDATKQLILVRCEGTSSNANLQFYEKSKVNEKNVWTETINCNAFIGKNGLGKTKEGDYKTPEGTFEITTAFGNKENPGTTLSYINVTEDLYSCDEPEFYNKIINVKETGHNCTGEHLIEYTPQYNYAMRLNYNESCEVGKGNSIFLHCTGPKDYTAGCIAISEENMKYILQHSTDGVKVCIYQK